MVSAGLRRGGGVGSGLLDDVAVGGSRALTRTPTAPVTPAIATIARSPMVFAPSTLAYVFS